MSVVTNMRAAGVAHVLNDTQVQLLPKRVGVLLGLEAGQLLQLTLELSAELVQEEHLLRGEERHEAPTQHTSGERWSDRTRRTHW